ncbi:MAG: hypothetical protein MI861_08295, partial [Pirellulales bacterium]|nr:hypothetical protein [Pirellulales bacterium]
MQYGLCAILSVVFCVAILYAKLKSEDKAMRKQLLAIHQTPLANDSPDGRLLVSQPVDSMHSDIRELLPESPEG